MADLKMSGQKLPVDFYQQFFKAFKSEYSKHPSNA